MKKILISLFYDGKTITEAVEYCARCYQETPTQKDIESAKKAVKLSGKVWE